MHSASLLKAVLKPHGLPNSSQKTLSVAKRETELQHSSESTYGQPTTKKASSTKRSCLCAPTSHPGSFRCRFHRSRQKQWTGKPPSSSLKPSPRPTSHVVPNEGLSIRKGLMLPPKAPLTSYNPRSISHTVRPSRLSRMASAANATIGSNPGSAFSAGATILCDNSPRSERDASTAASTQDTGELGGMYEITSNSTCSQFDGDSLVPASHNSMEHPGEGTSEVRKF